MGSFFSWIRECGGQCSPCRCCDKLYTTSSSHVVATSKALRRRRYVVATSSSLRPRYVVATFGFSFFTGVRSFSNVERSVFVLFFDSAPYSRQAFKQLARTQTGPLRRSRASVPNR